MLVKGKKRVSGIEYRESGIEIMFTIDLLKGRGIPAKSRPEGIAVAAATIAVPVIAAIVMLGFCLSSRIAQTIQKRQISSYEAKIDQLADAIELQKSLEKKKNTYSSCLSEVSSSIGRHTQWSSVLAAVVRNLPDSVVLTRLEAKQSFVRRKVPQRGDPEKMIETAVAVRQLQMKIVTSPNSNCDREVRDFKDRLRSSSFLAPKLENITVSQGFDTLGGRNVVSYEIGCVFKPGL